MFARPKTARKLPENWRPNGQIGADSGHGASQSLVPAAALTRGWRLASGAVAGSSALVRLLLARLSTLSWPAEDTDWPAEETQDEGRTKKSTRAGVGGVAAAAPPDANGPCCSCCRCRYRCYCRLYRYCCSYCCSFSCCSCCSSSYYSCSCWCSWRRRPIQYEKTDSCRAHLAFRAAQS